jgi:uncharacterized protein (TIGR00661 family)
MRILYGVVGEGMGHATRSRVVLDHLVKSHDVHVVASGRAHDYLKERFAGVHRIWGFTLGYEDNGVDVARTVMQNVGGAMTGWPQNIRQYFELAHEFKPELVVSDFESWSYLYGRRHGLPVISIDNMQIINRCEHAPEILEGFEQDFRMSKAVVKSKLPGASAYLIATFFYPKLRKKRTTLRPPLLRPEIVAAKAEKGEHLLVYQTSTSSGHLPGALAASGRDCHVYGYRRDLKAPVTEGKVTYMPFSEGGFIDDLRTCRAVIANGGFTLMSESVYLHKPFLSVPVHGQFEQVLNARYLQSLGYGQFEQTLTPDAVTGFLGNLPRHEAALAAYTQDGNREMLATLDELLAQLPGKPQIFEDTVD